MARVSQASIRSGPSRHSCYLRFVNKTGRKVNVIWVDYSGAHRYYGTLEPNRHFDIHTYEGHPWLSEDSLSKKRMLLNKSEVFYPKTGQNHVRRSQSVPHPGPNRPNRHYVPVVSNSSSKTDMVKREYVYITLPVFTLKELSTEVIIKNIHKRCDIGSLSLPNRLKTMLNAAYFP